MKSRREVYWTQLLFFSLLVWSCGSSKQAIETLPETLPNTVLWEIQSQDLKTSSYLLGTIHIIPEDMYFWPVQFVKAFDGTSQVVLETNELDMDPAAMMGLMSKIMMPDNQQLEDLVNEKDFQRIEDYFDEKGMPLRFFKNIKPFFLYMLIDIDMSSLSQDGFKSYEMEIMEMAKENQKPVLGLETLDFQISLFDSIPYQDQANLLVEAIIQKSKESGDVVDDVANDLYATYVKQDLNSILEQMQQSDVVLKKFNYLLLENRNRAWIPKIEKFIHEKPTLIAVGAAHLPGKIGVIQLLEQAGYTLKPIMNQPNGID